jgi:hypothetical protein
MCAPTLSGIRYFLWVWDHRNRKETSPTASPSDFILILRSAACHRLCLSQAPAAPCRLAFLSFIAACGPFVPLSCLNLRHFVSVLNKQRRVTIETVHKIVRGARNLVHYS